MSGCCRAARAPLATSQRDCRRPRLIRSPLAQLPQDFGAFVRQRLAPTPYDCPLLVRLANVSRGQVTGETRPAVAAVAGTTAVNGYAATRRPRLTTTSRRRERSSRLFSDSGDIRRRTTRLSHALQGRS